MADEVSEGVEGSVEGGGLASAREFVVRALGDKRVLAALGVVVVLVVFLASGLFAPRVESFTVSVLEGDAPVDGATVELFGPDGALLDSVLTTVGGRAVFSDVPAALLEVRARKTGFLQASKRVDAGQRTSLTLVLSPVDAGPVVRPHPGRVRAAVLNGTQLAALSFASASLASRVLVLVKDGSGNSVAGARVALEDAQTQAVLGARETVGGYAVFSDVTAGTRLRARVEKTGFVAAVTAERTVAEGETLRLDAVLLTPEEAANATGKNYATSEIEVRGDGRAVLASVFVVTLDGEIVASTDVENPWRAVVEEGDYYAVAAAPGFLFAVTPFRAGEALEFDLQRATPENAANVTVSVEDDEGKRVAGASVILRTAEGIPIPFPVQSVNPPSFEGPRTGANGEVSFAGLPRGTTVRVDAVRDEARGTADVTLSQAENAVNVRLTRATGRLTLVGMNPLAGNARVEFSARAQRGGKVVATCASSGGVCVLDVPALVPVNVSASAAGFLDAPAFETMVVPHEERSLDVHFISADAVTSSFVSFVGAFDARGRKLSNVFLGQDVELRFLVANAAGGRVGAFVSVEPEGGGIIGHSPRDAVARADALGLDCDAQVPDYGRRAHEWLEVSFNASAPAVRLVGVRVGVSPSLRADAFLFSYRSFFVNEGRQFRNPPDGALGLRPDAGEEGWCQANAFRANVSVRNPDAAQCTATACLDLEFEQLQDGRVQRGGAGFLSRAVSDCVVNGGLGACSRGPLLALFEIADLRNAPRRVGVGVEAGVAGVERLSVNAHDGFGGVISARGEGASASVSVERVQRGPAFAGVVDGEAVVLPLERTLETQFDVQFHNGVENAWRVPFVVRAADADLTPPPVAERTLIQDANNCPFNVTVRADPELGLLVPCSRIGLMVDTVFPADAVPFSVLKPEINVKIESADGSDACYEYDEVLGALKYNTEAPRCPAKFKATAAGIAGSSARVVLGYQGEFAELNVTVRPLPLPPDSYAVHAFNIRDVVRDNLRGPNAISDRLSSLKIFAIVSNKQLGSLFADLRDANRTELVRNAVGFRDPGALAFAWANARGPFSLELGGKKIADVPDDPGFFRSGAQLAAAFKGKARAIGEITAFRRNKDASVFCESGDLTNCRPTLEDWLPVRQVNETRFVPCDSPETGDVFCNQVFDENGFRCDPAVSTACTAANIPTYNYDARCSQDGVAELPFGQYVYSGRGFFACGFQGQGGGCFAACELPVNANCSSACSPENGYRMVVPVHATQNNGFGNVTCTEQSPYFDAGAGACSVPCFNHCQTTGTDPLCTPVGNSTASLGVRVVACGETYVSQLLGQELQCACVFEGEFDCRVPCDSFAGAPHCNPACNAQGVRPVSISFQKQVYVNRSPLVEVKLGFEGVERGFPFAFFGHEAEGNFTYYDIADATEGRGADFSALGISLSEQGEACEGGRGTYVLRADSVNGYQWTYSAELLALDSRQYHGAECRAPAMPLCAALYANARTGGEACVVHNKYVRDKAWIALGDGTYGMAPNTFVVSSNGYALEFVSPFTEGCNGANFRAYDRFGNDLGTYQVTSKHGIKGVCNPASWSALGSALGTCVARDATCGDGWGINKWAEVAIVAGVALAAGLVTAQFAENPDSLAAVLFLLPLASILAFNPGVVLSPPHEAILNAIEAQQAEVRAARPPPNPVQAGLLTPTPGQTAVAASVPARWTGENPPSFTDGRLHFAPLNTRAPRAPASFARRATSFWNPACVAATAACGLSVAFTIYSFVTCGGGTDQCSGHDDTRLPGLYVNLEPPNKVRVRSSEG